jgi:hypothetical protein
MLNIRTPGSSQAILRLHQKALNPEDAPASASQIRVFVPYTTPDLTRAALAAAASLTMRLQAEITLFAVRIVPFPLLLDEPDIPADWLERRLAALGNETAATVQVKVVLARDRDAGLRHVLESRSMVVVARKNRWWPTREARLARSLARAGHSVAMIDV